ncbi:E3 ubiquitin-protein ligase [Musa troglodytarum]|uniref:E3 ubiquitin-protein ligase n=1 Tax=Musa troglodytarum TaxID=320322 RepID=A0A9E7HTJ8_9LILI|nr:E3 ubiquitin-protein ligase [Musa troglodytarum]
MRFHSSSVYRFVTVRLPDIHKEVQCAICLGFLMIWLLLNVVYLMIGYGTNVVPCFYIPGIIRKTRTVMECLHRFCRACIDKSMRLGNNECPACRAHCASRRSLRDDSNYDTLIATLYPNIDKYEEEELAFHEEEMSCNKKLQSSMAEIFQRQTEALGKRRSTAKATAAAFVRRSQGNYRNHVSGRGGNGGRDTMAVSDDDDEEEANVNDVGKSYSSADEPSPDRRQKRRKRWGAPRSSPSQTAVNVDAGGGENDDFEFYRENNGASPLRVGNREAFLWGKNGARSQTRHGNTSGTNGRMVKSRMTKLVDHLRNLDYTVDEFDVHLTLVPLDKERIPSLQQPYLCCRPSLSIRHLCEYIALQTSVPAEEVQIYASMLQGGASAIKPFSSTDMANEDPLIGLQELEGQESVATLNSSFTGNQGELVSYLSQLTWLITFCGLVLLLTPSCYIFSILGHATPDGDNEDGVVPVADPCSRLPRPCRRRGPLHHRPRDDDHRPVPPLRDRVLHPVTLLHRRRRPVRGAPGAATAQFFEECDQVGAFCSRYVELHKPHLKATILRLRSSPAAALAIDFFATTMIDVADELGIPAYLYFTSSAATLALLLHAPTLHEKKNLPVVLDADEAVFIELLGMSPSPARWMPRS